MSSEHISSEIWQKAFLHKAIYAIDGGEDICYSFTPGNEDIEREYTWHMSSLSITVNRDEAQAELDRASEITDAQIEAGARALFGIACQMDFVLQDDLKAKVRKLDYDEKWAANDAFYRRTARIVLEAARQK